MRALLDIVLEFLRQVRNRGRLACRGVHCSISALANLQSPERIHLSDHCRIAARAHLRANSERHNALVLGNAVQVHEFVLLAANQGYIHVGARSWLAPYCLIYGNGGVELGDNVLLGPRVTINTVSHHASRNDIPINDQGIYCDPIVIENDVWIGAGATILQGVTIGEGSIIGAGSLVTTDIPAWSVAVGCPAKVIRNRREDSK